MLWHCDNGLMVCSLPSLLSCKVDNLADCLVFGKHLGHEMFHRRFLVCLVDESGDARSPDKLSESIDGVSVCTSLGVDNTRKGPAVRVQFANKHCHRVLFLLVANEAIVQD